MDLKQLKAIVKIMRNEGVLTLKTQEIELQLSPEAILSKNLPKNIQIDEPSEDDSPSDIDPMAFYSVNPQDN